LIDGTTGITSSNLHAFENKLSGACANESTDDLEYLVRSLFQNEGYHATQVKIGNHALQEAELRNALSLRKGRVFKRSVIASDLHSIRGEYLKKGFGDVVFIPDDTETHGNSTVNLTLTILEGTQYHMGKFKVIAKQDIAERLQSAWLLAEGTFFDFSYPKDYVSANRDLLPINFTPGDIRIIRNCPEATIEVWVVANQTASDLRSQPKEVKCEASENGASGSR